MRYFIDTEFIETGRDTRPTIDLISIGIVCEDGREYYAISEEFRAHEASEWVAENVIAQLDDRPRKPRSIIRGEIVEFIGNDTPEFWANHCAYDWVVFCWLFGCMIDLPPHFPKYCHDIKLLEIALGSPALPSQSDREHIAINDARYDKQVYELLCQLKDSRNQSTQSDTDQ